ncbi:hypothetical protein GBF38_019142 [Nibea albiflora]|uniref:Uncharacterized protein n=1 Tax=Nibea albiflora TaxID=240163 RepID=A0ACB7F136_NIBAL|nr:hypothetical protein GBF38_019142 [Nibea albiflora]
MSGSLQPYSSFLLLLAASLFLLLDSRVTPQDNDEGFLDAPYSRLLIPGPLEPDGGPGGHFAFGSSDSSTFPQQVESALIEEDEEQATQVWPRAILDYMRHQLRFRGRTKKSVKKGCT